MLFRSLGLELCRGILLSVSCTHDSDLACCSISLNTYVCILLGLHPAFYLSPTRDIASPLPAPAKSSHRADAGGLGTSLALLALRSTLTNPAMDTGSAAGGLKCRHRRR